MKTRLGLYLLEAEITTRCNLNCAHCYNRTREVADMPVSDVAKLLSFATTNDVTRFVVSGGEAVLHPNFAEIATIARNEKGATKVVVQSNGLIAESGMDQIRAFDIVHLSFEPDGSNVREGSGARVLTTARKFLDMGVYTYLFATVHPGNIDKIDWMVDEANRLKIDIGFNVCVAGHHVELQLSQQQRLAIIRKLHELDVAKRTLRFSSPFVAALKGQETERFMGIRGGCTAGIAACSVLPNGDVIPCPFFRIKAGNIHEKSMEDLWLHSEVFNSVRNRPAYAEPCHSCKHLSYCGGCRANALNKTGNLCGYDPGCVLYS